MHPGGDTAGTASAAEPGGSTGVALVKFVYLLWETESRPAGEIRRRLLERCAPAILALGVVSLVIDIDDEFSTVKLTNL